MHQVCDGVLEFLGLPQENFGGKGGYFYIGEGLERVGAVGRIAKVVADDDSVFEDVGGLGCETS